MYCSTRKHLVLVNTLVSVVFKIHAQCASNAKYNRYTLYRCRSLVRMCVIRPNGFPSLCTSPPPTNNIHLHRTISFLVYFYVFTRNMYSDRLDPDGRYTILSASARAMIHGRVSYNNNNNNIVRTRSVRLRAHT